MTEQTNYSLYQRLVKSHQCGCDNQHEREPPEKAVHDAEDCFMNNIFLLF